MEIELPDGTVLEAPEGSDPSVVAKNYLRQQRIAKIKADDPANYDVNSPQYKATHNATIGMSGIDKFMAGAGKSVYDMGRGIKQLGLGAADLVNPRDRQLSDLITDKPRSRYKEYAQEIDNTRRLESPLMSTGAGLAGNIAGTIASTAIPAGVLGAGARAAGMTRTAAVLGQVVNPTSLKAALGTGAALGALQPTGKNDSRLLNAGLGAAGSALGYGASKLVGRIANPVQSVPKPSYEKAVDVLREADVPIDAAQATGSSRLASVKRLLTDNPLTNAGQVSQAEKAAAGFDRAALKTIGEVADVADEAVMSRAASRIGNVMDDIAKRNPIKVDDSLLNSMANIASNAGKELESPQAAVIHSQIDEILAKATDGAIDGKAYQNIRGSLGRLQGSNQPGVKHWAGELKSAIDNALTRSASPEDASALTRARIQWRNMEGISKVIGAQEGQHISPAKLANALNTKGYGGKVAMVRGKGATDLMRLAKAGSTVLPDRFPQSGTAPRAALQLLLPGAIGAGYGYAKEGDMTGALKYAAGGMAAPWALQRLMNSPAGINYLSHGIPALSGRAGQVAGGLLGPAVRIAPAGLLLEAAQQ
jgi:hypothetical protein